MEYLKVTVTRINQKRNVWTKEYQYTTFSDIREMFEKTDTKDYYDILVKKKFFGIKEIVSDKEIFILENNANDPTLIESLKKLESLLNENNEIFISYRSSLDRNEKQTLNEVECYLEAFFSSAFSRAIGYKINNFVKPKKEKNNRRKIKAMIKNYKKN